MPILSLDAGTLRASRVQKSFWGETRRVTRAMGFLVSFWSHDDDGGRERQATCARDEIGTVGWNSTFIQANMAFAAARSLRCKVGGGVCTLATLRTRRYYCCNHQRRRLVDRCTLRRKLARHYHLLQMHSLANNGVD